MVEIRKSTLAYFCRMKLQVLETSVMNLFKNGNVYDIHSIILQLGIYPIDKGNKFITTHIQRYLLKQFSRAQQM